MGELKTKKIRQMGKKDIETKLQELRLELAKELAASEIGTVKNPGRIGYIKKTIARILTVKTERGGVLKK